MKLLLRTLAFIAILALVTGCAYFLHFHARYQPDSATYIIPAINLLNTHAFLDANLYPETLRTPGYSLLILPFLQVNLDLNYLSIFQHLLRILTILWATAFTFILTASNRQAIIVGVLLCIDMPMLSAANLILTEMFYTAVLMLIVWLLWTDGSASERHWSYSLLYGLVSGASVLIRPVSLFFFIPASAYLAMTRRTHRWQAVLSFVLAFAILPALWSTRNYRETGYFTVSTVTGYNMLFYRAAGVLAINQPGDFPVNLENRSKELKAQACADLKMLHSQECSALPFPLVASYYSKLGREIVLKHPVAYLKVAVRGAAVLMLGEDADSVAEIVGISPHLATRLMLMYTFPMLCFAIAGLVRFWKENRRFFYLSFLVISYFVVISAGADSYFRLRVPIIPIYVILAAAGIDWALGFFSKRHESVAHTESSAEALAK